MDSVEGKKLWVKRGKHPAFRPTLRIKSTGYAPAGQWQAQFFRPNIFPGFPSVREMPTVKEALAHYLAELKRCNHVAVEPPMED